MSGILVHTIHGIRKTKVTKLDPIIAVHDVAAASKWYQSVFDCRSIHGGNEFDVLVSAKDEVLLCLHQWGTHEHPTMTKPEMSIGNGLILYFRTENLEQVRRNVEQLGLAVEEEIQHNPNSHKREFSLRDPEGYYLTITEFHTYEG